MSQQAREKKAHDLFRRFDGNPALKPQDWPYPANAVFNPAAARLGNETLLLVRVGDVGDVVFPTGAVVYKDTDELRLYYGAADSTVAVATARLSEVLDYVLSSPIAHH